MLLTISATAGALWVYSQPEVSCGVTEAAIVRAVQGDLVEEALGSDDRPPGDLEKAARFCRSYWRDCEAWKSDRSAQVERICTEVTAFDAER